MRDSYTNVLLKKAGGRVGDGQGHVSWLGSIVLAGMRPKHGFSLALRVVAGGAGRTGVLRFAQDT